MPSGFASNIGADQPAILHSLISTFDIGLLKSQGFSYLSEVGARGLLIWIKKHLAGIKTSTRPVAQGE